ncbi:gap junction alpha-9 protein-like [Conger conger]|uniref:gap junction alpha-9 protein-like n=1 Tax=Conger conger TaxID=82655 RepID=UPI002A5B05C3|nr:gap junction alpha-9 protein-like [Conger conger]
MPRGDLNHRQSVHTAARHSKMGDWNFLGGILEEVHIHSTMVGKIWLTILFIFRMLVLGVAAEDVWTDEQSGFVCNTEQPGCHNVCYDRAFPVSLVRLWVLQVIFVSSPSLAYMGHALYRLRALDKERRRRRAQLRAELDAGDAGAPEDRRRRLERELRSLEHGKPSKAPLRGSLLRSYVAHIVARSAVELSFMTGQYLLYGFRLEPLYKCERAPCPNAVDCFVSRPSEKSVFMVFMQCIAGVSLLLGLLEILHLAYRRMKHGILDYCPHLREEPDYCYSQKPRASASASAAGGHKSAVPTAPSGYSLLPEKEAYPHPVDPPSAFTLVQGNGRGGDTDGLKESKEAPETPAKGDRKGDAPIAKAPPPTAKIKQGAEPEKPPGGLPVATVTGGGVGGRKPRRVSTPSIPATLPEGRPDTAAGGRTRFGAGQARPASRSDLRRFGRSQTPESVEESGSESQPSPRKLFPGHRTSLASNASSRWAATDLMI